MSPGFAGLVVLTTLLAVSHAVDIGPVSLHKTRCLSSRFKECEECYHNRTLAMCHRLSLGKFHRLVAWTAGRTEDMASAQVIITEACDYLMNRDVSTDSIMCTGFKDIFVNEGSGLETGGSDMANAMGARKVCQGVFNNAGFNCAIAFVSITVDADGENIGIVITIVLAIGCAPQRAIFDLALLTLRNTAGFADIFVDAPVLDFNPTGNSTLSLPFSPDRESASEAPGM